MYWKVTEKGISYDNEGKHVLDLRKKTKSRLAKLCVNSRCTNPFIDCIALEDRDWGLERLSPPIRAEYLLFVGKVCAIFEKSMHVTSWQM